MLLVSNHQSFLDPPLIGSCITTRDTDFLARGGLFGFKPFAWVIRKLNATPIRQGAGDIGAIKEVVKRLGEAKSVVIFPEGSRTHDGKIHPFSRGFTVLLKRSNCAVIPVGIAGVYEVWPRHKRIPRVWTRPIAIAYGKPIDSDELMREGADQAIETIFERVSDLAEQAEGLR